MPFDPTIARYERREWYERHYLHSNGGWYPWRARAQADVTLTECVPRESADASPRYPYDERIARYTLHRRTRRVYYWPDGQLCETRAPQQHEDAPEVLCYCDPCLAVACSCTERADALRRARQRQH